MVSAECAHFYEWNNSEKYIQRAEEDLAFHVFEKELKVLVYS